MLEFSIELLFIIVICCCFQYYHGYCHALATSIKLLKRHYQRRPSSHITIGLIIKARHFLNKHGLIALYYSFLYPYLSYCNHIWGSTYKTNLKKLTTLQNKAIRIISHMNARKNCDAMYNELGIIKFVKMNKYLFGRFMFRVYHRQVPEFFSPFLVRNRDIHQHETRLAGHFHIPPVKLDLSKTGIKYKGAIIWNIILQEDVNLDVSEAVCKQILIKMLNIM